MKHRSHKFDKLIKVADDVLLREYFDRKGYPVPADQKVTLQYIDELLDKLDEETSLELEEELLCINDIADKSVDRLGEIIEQFGIQCDEKEPPETTALRIYLHPNNEAFELAYDFYLCDMYSERLNHYPVSCDNFEFSEENISAFAEEMSTFFEETRQTEHCYIRQRVYQGKYYVLVARGEPKKTLLELDGKRMKPRVYRPAKEDIIVYNKDAGVLSLSSGRRKDEETRQYITSFGQKVLGVEQIDEETFSKSSRLINLEPILTSYFYNRTDEIVEVKLRQLFFIHHARISTDVILKSDDILESVELIPISVNGSQLVSAKLDVYLKDRKRPVPVHLTTRGSTIIKQRREKEIVEGFLRERSVLAF